MFLTELIRPCLCDTTWHRCCIREHIVRNEIICCPDCEFEYCVGYSDCYATFNKRRSNYLLYILVQELLLFGCQWLVLGGILALFDWNMRSYNPHAS